MSIGKWLELKGFDVKPNAAAKPPAVPTQPAASPAPAPEKSNKDKPLKDDKDKGPPVPYEPWLDVLKNDFKPIKVSRPASAARTPTDSLSIHQPIVHAQACMPACMAAVKATQTPMVVTLRHLP